MYSQITHPLLGVNYSIFSPEGSKTLRMYVQHYNKYMSGGGAEKIKKHMPTSTTPSSYLDCKYPSLSLLKAHVKEQTKLMQKKKNKNNLRPQPSHILKNARRLKTIFCYNASQFTPQFNPLRINFVPSSTSFSEFKQLVSSRFPLGREIGKGKHGNVYTSVDNAYALKFGIIDPSVVAKNPTKFLLDMKLEMWYHYTMETLGVGPELAHPHAFFLKPPTRAHPFLQSCIVMKKYSYDLGQYCELLAARFRTFDTNKSQRVRRFLRHINQQLKFITTTIVRFGLLCFDIKSKNILVQCHPDTLRCNRIVLTDFGSDFCCRLFHRVQGSETLLCQKIQLSTKRVDTHSYLEDTMYIAIAFSIFVKTYGAVRLLQAQIRRIFRKYSPKRARTRFHAVFKTLCTQNQTYQCNEMFAIEYYLLGALQKLDTHNMAAYQNRQFRISDLLWNAVLLMQGKQTVELIQQN